MPRPAAGRIGQDLHVHAMTFVPAAVVRPLLGDPIDRNQGSVEDRVRQPGRPAGGFGDIRGLAREQPDGFPWVPPHRADADREPVRQTGQGVAVPQVGQGQQCLPMSRQSPPPSSDFFPTRSDRSVKRLRLRVDSGMLAG